MPRRVLRLDGVSHDAPIPLAVEIDGLIYTSALMGMDPATGEIPDDPARQTQLLFSNLKALLAEGGATKDDVAKMTVFLADNSVRPLLNQEWLSWYPDEDDRPARHVIVQPLPRNVQIQLEIVAVNREARNDGTL